MTSSITLVFPHQLFRDHPAVDASRTVLLVEEDLFFRQYAFHKQKLVFHRASMKMYADYLRGHGFDVEYVEQNDRSVSIHDVVKRVSENGVVELHLTDPTDYLLMRRLKRAAKAFSVHLEVLANPQFLCTDDELDAFFKTKKKYLLFDFYVKMRKNRGVLLHADESPIGGKWTFDEENRKRLAPGTAIPAMPAAEHDAYLHEAVAYVERCFPENPGRADGLVFPFHFDEVQLWLERFFSERFHHFGVFQDAIVKHQAFLFHAAITPMLNAGLLTPHQVLSTALEFADRLQIPINSLEGFVRQVLGWREFVRGVYVHRGC
jgi:deoxyribodipyrimidine photolyase-related protein